MELLYLYIKDDHRNIKNCEFNFSPNYKFSFDDKKKTFSLIEETNIEHWFGPNISNITAVIGKNGAGKSNMIECLINALCYQGGGIVIFKYKGVLWTNLHSRLTNYKFDFKIHRMSRFGSPLDAGFQEHVNDAAVIYYSPTIDRRISGNHYHCFTDISNAFLLRTAQQNTFNSIPDFAKSADVDYMQLVDTFRLMLFFIYTKKHNLKIPEDLRRPQYLNISLLLYNDEPTDKNYRKIKSECDDTFPGKLKYFMLWQFYMSKALPKDKEMSFDNIILFFNHNEPYRPNMYNLLVELYKNGKIKYNNDISRNTKRNELLFSIETNSISNELLNAIYCYYYINQIAPYASFRTLNLVQNIKNDSIKINWDGMSSGERSFYNLLSRLCGEIYKKEGEINNAAENKIEISNEYDNKSIILLLDEAELSMHPEWQQKFINMLIDSFQKLFPKIEFQIIIASHSPILISDIPKRNIIFMDKNKDGSCKICNASNRKETFGANIHTLFNDSFFLNGLPIGDFAKYKIQELFNRAILDHECTPSLLYEINLIGEPLLKNKLKELFDKNKDHLSNAEKIKVLESELKLLKNKENDKN